MTLILLCIPIIYCICRKRKVLCQCQSMVSEVMKRKKGPSPACICNQAKGRDSPGKHVSKRQKNCNWKMYTPHFSSNNRYPMQSAWLFKNNRVSAEVKLMVQWLVPERKCLLWKNTRKNTSDRKSKTLQLYISAIRIDSFEILWSLWKH